MLLGLGLLSNRLCTRFIPDVARAYIRRLARTPCDMVVPTSTQVAVDTKASGVSLAVISGVV